MAEHCIPVQLQACVAPLHETPRSHSVGIGRASGLLPRRGRVPAAATNDLRSLLQHARRAWLSEQRPVPGVQQVHDQQPRAELRPLSEKEWSVTREPSFSWPRAARSRHPSLTTYVPPPHLERGPPPRCSSLHPARRRRSRRVHVPHAVSRAAGTHPGDGRAHRHARQRAHAFPLSAGLGGRVRVVQLRRRRLLLRLGSPSRDRVLHVAQFFVGRVDSPQWHNAGSVEFFFLFFLHFCFYFPVLFVISMVGVLTSTTTLTLVRREFADETLTFS